MLHRKHAVTDTDAHLMNSGMYLGCAQHQAVSWPCSKVELPNSSSCITYMMGKVGIHDNDIVATGMSKSMYICSTCSWASHSLHAKQVLQK